MGFDRAEIARPELNDTVRIDRNAGGGRGAGYRGTDGPSLRRFMTGMDSGVRMRPTDDSRASVCPRNSPDGPEAPRESGAKYPILWVKMFMRGVDVTLSANESCLRGLNIKPLLFEDGAPE
jgi:hypothetical protein